MKNTSNQPSGDGNLMKQAEAAYAKGLALNSQSLEILQGIHDKETADSAVGKWGALEKAKRDLMELAEEGGYGEVLGELLSTPAMEEVQGSIYAEFDRLKSVKPRCYGSQELVKCLFSFDLQLERVEKLAGGFPEELFPQDRAQQARALFDKIKADIWGNFT